MNRLHGKFAPNEDADLAEEDDPRPILKLKAELALHRATRRKNHFRAGCAACRLYAWLEGEGSDPVQAQEVRSYQSHGWRT